MQEMINMQTHVPKHIAVFMRQLAVIHYGRLNLMYADMMEKFLQVKPWAATPPLKWKHPPTVSARNAVQGLAVANIHVPSALHQRIMAELVTINNLYPATRINAEGDAVDSEVSLRIFAYTAIFWWTKYVYPLQPVR